jgi:hypothetical protein
MKILVCPPAAGSDERMDAALAAVRLAGAVRNLRHEVLVAAEPGAVSEAALALGLEHLPLPPRRRRPSPGTAGLLARLAAERGTDLIHAYGWPAGLEAFLVAGVRRDLPVVCTVSSSLAARFLPSTMPLVVPSDAERRGALRGGHTRVHVIEPGVDVRADSPEFGAGRFRAEHGLDEHLPLAVLAAPYPSGAIGDACDAVAGLVRDGTPIQLAVVGSGAVRDLRPALAAADVVLGAGSAALRGMAFGRPVLIPDRRRGWRACTPDTVEDFLLEGWYGFRDPAGPGRGAPDGAQRLRSELHDLLAQPARRTVLGEFGRRLVTDRFNLEHVAELTVRVYASAATMRSR